MPNPAELSREALIEIAEYARDFLYLDLVDGRDVWNPDKDVSGYDYIDHMNIVLGKYDLIPAEMTPTNLGEP